LGTALTESFTFLVIEQAYVVHTDFRWVVSENGIPFNHFWRDYKQSLSEWTQSGWDDGDPNWFGYIGHPIQGALTGFIQIQNDPKSQKLEFSKTKAYWKSRLKAAFGMPLTVRSGTWDRSVRSPSKNTARKTGCPGMRMDLFPATPTIAITGRRTN